MDVDLPLMGMGAIGQVRKAGILESKTWTAEVGVGRNANDRVHDLVEQPAMRDHQVFARLAPEQTMQGLTRA